VVAGRLQGRGHGNSRCVVQAGALDDRSSGSRIRFRKAQADEVQIDHVVPLAYAWDMGVWARTLDQGMASFNHEALHEPRSRPRHSAIDAAAPPGLVLGGAAIG